LGVVKVGSSRQQLKRETLKAKLVSHAVTKKVFAHVVLVGAATIAQLCRALASRDSGPSGPATAAITPPAAGIDAAIRNDVLRALARELESGYAVESTANKLAALVRAKQKANAYKNITSAPEFPRALTHDLYAVAHDKHLQVNFSLAPLP
jgi:hypothetical protein